MRIRVAAVDADILLWKFGYRHQHEIEWEPDLVSAWVEEDVCFGEASAFIQELKQKTKSDEVLLCFTHMRNFRYTVLETYKHNRKDAVKPKLYEDLKDYLKENFLCKSEEWLEADDVLGILATKPNKRVEYVICSIDKDLEQIPGLHFNWDKDESVRRVTKLEADRVFWTQCLTGDPTDGFSGIPRVGIKTAEKILGATISPRWQDAVMDAYMSKCLSYEYFLQQCRMARILRDGDYDCETGKVILWEPK